MEPTLAARPRNGRAALAGACFVLLAGVRSVDADPRWWWNDIRLTDTPTDSITPHVTTPGYAVGNSGANDVFVTWAEVDPVQGDLEVWARASFDGGCSFCDAIRITDDDYDEVEPRIAVLALPSGTWSVGIIMTDARGEAVIAWDSTTMHTATPFDGKCAEWQALGPAIIANAQYVRFGGLDAVCTHADLVGIGTPDFGHFHAVWQEDGLTGPSIRYAHDLIGRGGPGWLVDPVKTLPPANVMADAVGFPRVAGDLTTDPDPVSGNTTHDRSGVDVVFLESDPVGPTDRLSLVGLRSIDSGVTFSPDGVRADAPPAAVSDSVVGLGRLGRPALDAASNENTTVDPSWVAAAWDDFRAGGASPDMECDGRRFAAPNTTAPDWQTPDVKATSADDGRPTLAVQDGFGTNPAPVYLAFNDSRFGGPEIVYRGGLMDPTAATYLDYTRFPIAPVRPLDTAVSQDLQLSACTVDPNTLACNPSRAAGDARDAALDGNEIYVYAVWSDSRDGNREIYLKRTDRRVSNQPPRLSAACDAAGGAYVDVDFDVIPQCPQPRAGERMARYLIYYGTNPGGPYDNAAAPIVILASGAPGPTFSQRIGGLLSGTTYQVIVVPEDEARNVNPASFDPSQDGAAAWPNEASITTPSPCVAEICLFRSDVTSLSPYAPPRNQVYLVPPSPNDISLQGVAYQCPIADGDLEQDANAFFNHVPLVLYQVDRAVGTLRLARSGNTIQFHF